MSTAKNQAEITIGGQPVTLSPAGVNDPLTTTGMKITYDLLAGKLQEDGSGGYKIKEATATKVDISQVPQVTGPVENNTLENAISDASKFKTDMENLADSDSNNALNKTGRLSAPPIERVRNDEAVFDYLLDGYRNTQISSGADYGGMVRRVLPFSFTFTPGSNSESGFGARVVLKLDDKEVRLASEILKKHVAYVNQDRISGYTQYLMTSRLLLKESSNKPEETNKSMDSLYKEFRWNFYDHAKEAPEQETGLKNPNFVAPSKAQFWQAYRVSLDAIRRALDDKYSNAEAHFYQYTNLTPQGVMKSILKKIKTFRKITEKSDVKPMHSPVRYSGATRSFYPPNIPEFSSQKTAVQSSLRQLNDSIANMIERGTPLNKWQGTTDFNELMSDINNLAMSMTSAGLVFDLYLQSNPLFIPTKQDGSDKKKTMITMIPDGNEYQAQLYQVTYDDVEALVKTAAQPRIVENTSREHVVEIADTAKINTLLSAAIQGNEVSAQLGLTLGAELAAAVSSSSAFIKRIPYAVPINGQDSEGFKNDKNKNQVFGWRYYKTPAGVTQFGGIAQAFKVTPLNSSVVVTMPEWMGTLKAEYEISPDGDSDWKTFGEETVTLSGAAIRGALSDSKMHAFDTWVKYHIYKEVDGSIGLPVIKSCVANNAQKKVGGEGEEKIPVIYGSRGGEMAICGENLYGVKGVMVGGQYIHDEIKKVSSNLIHLKTNRFKTLQGDTLSETKRCGKPEPDSTEECKQECKIALLSDFGVSSNAVGCIQFVSVADEVKSSVSVIDAEGRFSASETDKNLTFTIKRFRGVEDITYYRFVRSGETRHPQDEVEWKDGKATHKISTKLNKLINKCVSSVGEKPCAINLEVLVEPLGISGSWVLLGTIDDVYEYFYPYTINQKLKASKGGMVTLKNDYFAPSKVFVGKKEHVPTLSVLNFTMTRPYVDKYCSDDPCLFKIEYTGITGTFPGTIDFSALP